MLYLIDKPHADIGLRTAQADEEAFVVLLQDGVLLEPDIDATVYAVEPDVAIRGVDLPAHIDPISYDALVEAMFETEVKTFV